MRSKSIENPSPERAWQYALRLLAARDYTRAKLYEKLLVRGFPEEDAEAALHRLENEKLISDHRFAERFAESAVSAGRFFGPRLRLEMRRCGVPADMIDEVSARIAGEHDESDEVRCTLEKRFPSFSNASADDREKRRVVGFLQRRGFGIATILRVLKER
ncbi:regulatory protein RecX [Geobacter sp. SVR]|uniref:regulatory protein RecX n=1 Tax=Geobacter sp. SVR TaxID=2495594 RepID=UPI00143EFFF7|nr:regulatory protein RecX [Geobacter sp. SVR]BCS55547.1 regulatory protein RecX [Geobacter sp. SVR]GCF83550.1 regulatory protein RecX [Geobacter sp. SVR]